MIFQKYIFILTESTPDCKTVYNRADSFEIIISNRIYFSVKTRVKVFISK